MENSKKKAEIVNNRKSIKDVLNITKISDRQLNNLLRKMKIVIFAGPIEEEILYDDFRKIIYHKDINQLSKIAAFYGVRRIKKEKLEGSHIKFESESKALIEYYEKIISDVTNIHFINLKRLDLFVDETPVVAAYTLFAKSLNLLNMICLNLKYGYLNCLMLFRPLDEAVLLAEYFMLSKDLESGKKDLTKWFRENRSPSVKILRERFNQFSKQNLSLPFYQVFEGLLNQLHDKQSKSIHNTFADLRSIFEIDVIKGDVMVKNFEYTGSNNFRNRLEMTLFFLYKIHNVVQGMICCFEIAQKFFPPEDVKAINIIDQNLKLKVEETRNRLQSLYYD